MFEPGGRSALTPVPQLITESLPIVIHDMVQALAKNETFSSTFTPAATTVPGPC